MEQSPSDLLVAPVAVYVHPESHVVEPIVHEDEAAVLGDDDTKTAWPLPTEQRKLQSEKF